jgi:hypothetical protein
VLVPLEDVFVDEDLALDSDVLLELVLELVLEPGESLEPLLFVAPLPLP